MNTANREKSAGHGRHRQPFRWPRLLWNILILGLMTWAFLGISYPLTGQEIAWKHFSRFDPWTAATFYLNESRIYAWFGASLVLMAVTALFGRFFCGWLCPLGSVLIIADELRSLAWSLKSKKPLIGNKPAEIFAFLNRYRYAWLLAMAALVMLGSLWPLFLSPSALMGHEIRQLRASALPYIFVFILLLAWMSFPRFWCTYLCPTGLLLQAAARWRRWSFRIGEGCNQCGLCQPHCPVAAIDLERGQINESCTLCGACFDHCRRHCIEFGRVQREHSVEMLDLRRSLLQFLGAGLLALPLIKLTQPGQPLQAAVLRPPGALPEARFVDTCIRCHRCIQACPTGTLQPAGLNQGFRAFDSPVLHPELARCELEMLCAEVCPTGALKLVPANEVKIGLAVINPLDCINWRDGTLCLLCLEHCPVLAIFKDDRKRPYVNPNLCVGCGSCEFGCPATPKAIIVNILQ